MCRSMPACSPPSASLLRSSVEWTLTDLIAPLSRLAGRAHTDLAEEGFRADDVTLTASLAMRYVGQAFEIDVPLPHSILADLAHSPSSSASSISNTHQALIPELAEDFHRRHAKLYGYANPRRGTEAVQLRLRASGRTEKPILRSAEDVLPQAPPEPNARGSVIFSGRSRETPVFHRGQLAPGMGGSGPAIVVTGESTSVVPPGPAWSLDAAGSLLATRSTLPSRGRKGDRHAI